MPTYRPAVLPCAVLPCCAPLCCTAVSIPDPWIWLYWINPMTWTIQSVAISELSSSEWDAPAVKEGSPNESIGLVSID